MIGGKTFIELARKLIDIIDRRMPRQVQSGKVTAVDMTKRTCTVDPGDGRKVWEEVRLQAVGDLTSGLCIKPKVGSSVLVAMIDNNKANLCVVSTAETDEIQLNGDQYKGLVKLAPLVQKINAIENDLNSAKTAFTTWTPVPNDGGAALKAATASWAGQQITITQEGDLENTIVKHG